MILVRRLGPGDLDALYAFRLRALATDPGAFYRTYAEEVARGPAHLARALAAFDEGAVFGAFANHDMLVGMVGVHREAAVKARHKASIWGMFVDEAARGQGLGAELLDRAVAHARDDLRSLQVHLSAEASHAAALALYRSRGFVVWGTEPRGTMLDGRASDELHLWLDLTVT